MEISSKTVSSSSEGGLFKSILDRRIPQILGLYIGGAWTLFGILQWMVNRYVLSPYLEELYLMTVLLFLPAVIIIAYGHGAPGKDRWKRHETVGLACNAVLAVAVLSFTFWGKDLGSAREVVQIVDDAGNEVERVVPKADFRKRVAFFYFSNDSGLEESNWLQMAIPHLIYYDISQDLFFTIQPPELFKDSFQKAGFQNGLNLPMALKRRITTDYNLDYFISGSFEQRGDTLLLNTTLTEASNGKEVSTHQYRGDDLFSLVDQVSVDIKSDLDLPKQHIEDTIDLPVSELFTGSMQAMQAYQTGVSTSVFDSDFASAIANFEEATTQDPTFAMANVQKYIHLLQQGQMQPAMEALGKAQQHDYRLTEQMKYGLKVGKLNLQGNHAQALQAAKQWSTLYPDDILAHQILGMIHTLRSEFDEAIEANLKLLEIDPNQDNVALEVGRLFREAGRTDDAIAQYEAFIEEYPERDEGYAQLASVYADQGNLDKELEMRRKAISISPDNPAPVRSLATVLRRMGSFDEALKHYEQALSISKTPQEQASSLESIAAHYWFRGQHQEAISRYNEALAIYGQYFPQIALIIHQARLAVPEFYEAGFIEEAKTYAEAAYNNPASQQFPDLRALAADAMSFLYAEEARYDEALAIIEDASAFVEASGFTLLRANILSSKGHVYAHSNQFDEALNTYEQFLTLEPHSTSGWYKLGFIQHDMGDYKKAKKSFEQALTYSPYNPMALLGLGKTERALGNDEAARTHLERALLVWENSDPNNVPWEEARALMAEM